MFSETHTENSNRHINASQPHTGMKSVIESDNKDWTQEYEQIDMTYISPSQEPSNTQQNSFLDDIRRRIEQVKQQDNAIRQRRMKRQSDGPSSEQSQIMDETKVD